MVSTAGFIPVQPGRRGNRGIAYAPTRRLKELRNYYAERANDATADDGFRRYAAELVAEVVEEIDLRNLRSRRRRGKTVAA